MCWVQWVTDDSVCKSRPAKRLDTDLDYVLNARAGLGYKNGGVQMSVQGKKCWAISIIVGCLCI